MSDYLIEDSGSAATLKKDGLEVRLLFVNPQSERVKNYVCRNHFVASAANAIFARHRNGISRKMAGTSDASPPVSRVQHGEVGYAVRIES
jgi:hypothetical protein